VSRARPPRPPALVLALAALLAYAQAGYLALLALLARVLRLPAPVARPGGDRALPRIALIIAAHDEESVIEAKVRNARDLDWPRDRLRIVVASDGSTDATVAKAQAAGADLVLDLPWGGKVRAQDAAVDAVGGEAELLAFGDANALWERDALHHLSAAFADPDVGYACGQVAFVGGSGTNQEGLYWRYEMALRALESRLHAVTGGNGAIYAVRPDAYLRVDEVMGHDLSFPFQIVKRGLRAVYVPEAKATEKMVPSIEGEWARKRRMMSHAWPIVVRAGMADPRGYPPRYALMIASHRLLRYASPFLHVALLALSLLRAPRAGRLERALLGAQLLLLAGTAAGGRVRFRPLLVARYYVLTQASIAMGLWDWLRHGTPAGWQAPEGTR
jgi:cellulose synthase/poly-beta-1,6-N-acetylglucosamine synthase-like glycosyltransferase